MSKCKWRNSPGADENCGMMADAGEDYCPRHGRLAQVKAAAKDAREGAKARSVGKAAPNTRGGLLTLGYLFLGNQDCSGCGEAIEWWLTYPNKKRQPFNPMREAESVAVPHHATCKHASEFRRRA